MRKIFIKVLTLSVLFSTLFLGCNMEGSDTIQKNPGTQIIEEEIPTVYISIQNVSRSANSSLPENIYYKIKATNESGTIVESEDPVDDNPNRFPMKLTQGTWTFGVTGYSDEACKIPILTSTYNKPEDVILTIGSGKYYFSVNVEQIKDDGFGSVNLPIQITNSTIKKLNVNASLSDIDGNYDVGEDGIINFSKTKATSGTYTAILSFYNNLDVLIMRTIETINVRQNSTSEWETSQLSAYITKNPEGDNKLFTIDSETVRNFTNTVLYVTDTGDDNNTGTWKKPFKTLKKATDRAAALNAEYALSKSSPEDANETFTILIDDKTGDKDVINVRNISLDSNQKLSLIIKPKQEKIEATIPKLVSFGSNLNVQSERIIFKDTAETLSPLSLNTCTFKDSTGNADAVLTTKNAEIELFACVLNGKFKINENSRTTFSSGNTIDGLVETISPITAILGTNNFVGGIYDDGAKLELVGCRINGPLTIKNTGKDIESTLKNCYLGSKTSNINVDFKNSCVTFSTGNMLYLKDYTVESGTVTFGSNQTFAVSGTMTLNACNYKSTSSTINIIRNGDSDPWAILDIKNGAVVDFITTGNININKLDCKGSTLNLTGGVAMNCVLTLNSDSNISSSSKFAVDYTSINYEAGTINIADSLCSFKGTANRFGNSRDTISIGNLNFENCTTDISYYKFIKGILKIKNGTSNISNSNLGDEDNSGPLEKIDISGADCSVEMKDSLYVSANELVIDKCKEFIVTSKDMNYVYIPKFTINDGAKVDFVNSEIDKLIVDDSDYISLMTTKNSNVTLNNSSFNGDITVEVDSTDENKDKTFKVKGDSTTITHNVYLKDTAKLTLEGTDFWVPFNVYHMNPDIGKTAVVAFNASGRKVEFDEISWLINFLTPGRYLAPTNVRNTNYGNIEDNSEEYQEPNHGVGRLRYADGTKYFEDAEIIDPTKEIVLMFTESGGVQLKAITFTLYNSNYKLLGSTCVYDYRKEADAMYNNESDNPVEQSGICIADYTTARGTYIIEVVYADESDDDMYYKESFNVQVK